MLPRSQSTHRPTREAGQLLPISVTLPAPATLHKTPFVDVAEGIDGDGDGWHSTGAYCTAKLTFSRGSPVIVWGAYCTSVRIVFEILRYTWRPRQKENADNGH